MFKVTVDYAYDEKIRDVLAALSKHGGFVDGYVPEGFAGGNPAMSVRFFRKEAAVSYLRERYPDDSEEFCASRVNGPTAAVFVFLPEQTEVARTLLEFHLDDVPNEYYPDAPFRDLCRIFGVGDGS